MSLRRVIVCLRAVGLIVLAAGVLCGCATPSLTTARKNYYRGNFSQAEQDLLDAKVSNNDRVLMLMERGTIRQAEGKYKDSSRDFIDASDKLDELETYSVSKGASSLVVNDQVQDFKGAPFERTLLHSLTAINHFSVGDWDNGAVEARRIIKSLAPETKGTYPEEAFSRYIAGFAFEMTDDRSNAELQYKKAADLVKLCQIDPKTGALGPISNTNGTLALNLPTPQPEDTCQLVCFVFLGKSPTGRQVWSGERLRGLPMYAELYLGDRYLGHSYTLADTEMLAFTTEQLQAARKAAKAVSRVLLKDAIASGIESATDNEALGALTRIILIGMLERPDLRRWETLPHWLQVARVPCPPDLKNFEVHFKNAAGGTVRIIQIDHPITHQGNIFFSLCRDLQPIVIPVAE